MVGLKSALIGSFLVTLYATWSPWHFSGQNYSVALMFLRRRGVPVDPRAKRFLYASFLLSFALSFLVLHGQTSTLSYASVAVNETSAFRFLSLNLPSRFIALALPVTSLAYVASLIGASILLLRDARPRELLPILCLVLTQSLWFALPAALPALTGSHFYGLAFTVIWVSAAHGLQYLWVTSFYARREDPALRLGPYLGRTLVAGSTVTIFPALLFAPGLLGTVPWDHGLALLLISVVNLHHFVLDGAVWKLRDGRVARLLLRDTPPDTAGGRSRVAWFGPAIALLGSISLIVGLLDLWEREVGVNRAGGDLNRILVAAERLSWIGRDVPALRSYAAAAVARGNQLDAAAVEYQRSLDLYPTTTAWVGLGQVYAGQTRWREAAEAFSAALEIDPDDGPALFHSGSAWMELSEPDRARQTLERARALFPEDKQIRIALERAIEAQSRASE